MLYVSTNKKIDPYLQQKVMSASPAQLVSYIYDIGISACINNDKIKLNKVLSHLKETLITVPIQEMYQTPFPLFMIIYHF